MFILNVCFLTAKGVIQKEVVYFGLSKQEVVLLQRPVGEDKTFSLLQWCMSSMLTTIMFECVCVHFRCCECRMQRRKGSFSSAQSATVTPWRSTSQSMLGGTSGSVALWWRHLSDSLSSCASRRGSRGSGWTPSDRSCPGPCHRRIIPVSNARKYCQQCTVHRYVSAV